MGTCRKIAGGGGFAINIMGRADSLKIVGQRTLQIYRAEIANDDGHCKTISGQRHFCARCASALWMADPAWSDLFRTFASSIDSVLPVPPSRVHLMLRFKAGGANRRSGPATRPSISIPSTPSSNGTGTKVYGSTDPEIIPILLGD